MVKYSFLFQDRSFQFDSEDSFFDFLFEFNSDFNSKLHFRIIVLTQIQIRRLVRIWSLASEFLFQASNLYLSKIDNSEAKVGIKIEVRIQKQSLEVEFK